MGVYYRSTAGTCCGSPLAQFSFCGKKVGTGTGKVWSTPGSYSDTVGDTALCESSGTLRFYISDVAAADFLCTGVNIVTDA